MFILHREGPCLECGHHSDQLGDHALCCGVQGEGNARHHSLKDAFCHATVYAAFGPVSESCGLIPARVGCTLLTSSSVSYTHLTLPTKRIV